MNWMIQWIVVRGEIWREESGKGRIFKKKYCLLRVNYSTETKCPDVWGGEEKEERVSLITWTLGGRPDARGMMGFMTEGTLKFYFCVFPRNGQRGGFVEMRPD